MLQMHNGVLQEVPSSGVYPWRVKNRILLHQIGACEMFTAIVPPGERVHLADLRLIADEAASVNAQIGLPTNVKDLFIRTREAGHFINMRPNSTEGAKARLAGTNPVLQIRGVRTDLPEYVQLKTEFTPEKRVGSVEEWLASIPPSYLLIHEENPELQRKSIHGRVMSVEPDGPFELAVGTDALHARMIGLNGSRYVSVEGHDIRWMCESVLLGNERAISDRSFNFQSAFKLMQRVEPYLEKLLHTLEELKRIYRPNIVIEFRIYPEIFDDEPVLAGLQVYDLDEKLAR